jgi:hypothetical protein
MKKLWPLVTLLLVVPLARAQETAPPRDGTERKFAGEVVSTDTTNKTLTVKASGVDSKGEQVEKTVSMPVADSLVERLGTLTAGDKITVVWRKDDAQQKEVIIAFAKSEPPPSDKP